MAGLIMFIAALLMLGIGFPVAFTFGAVAMIFGMVGSVVESLSDGDGLLGSIEVFKDMFNFMPYRIFSIMESRIFIAVPLFVFMGVVLQKSKLAERLLESMGMLFGEIRGGIAISTILVGALAHLVRSSRLLSCLSSWAISFQCQLASFFTKLLCQDLR